MTNWTREFISGRTVYVIRADPLDPQGAANLVMQLLPQLMFDEEIRVRPLAAPPDLEPGEL